MQFFEDGHLRTTFRGQHVPQNSLRSRRALLDADGARRGADQVEGDVERLARNRLDDLGVVDGGGDDDIRGYPTYN